MNTFNKILFLLPTNLRKQGILLLIVLLISALLDVIGIASIVPFIAVLSNPEIVDTNLILNKIFKITFMFGIESTQDFIFFIGVCIFFLLIITLTTRAVSTYLQIRFGQMCEYSVCKLLVERYLNQPYSWFLNRNSAELGKTIFSEVGAVVGGCIKPFIEVIAKGMIAVVIILLLIILNPKLAAIVALSFCTIYGIFFFLIKGYLKQIGEKRLKHNEIRFISVSEGFGAIKEVKVGALENIYVKLFENSALIFAKTQAISQIISQLPRFVLEAIAFGGILLIILYIISQTNDFNDVLPIVSVYVLAGYRMLPAVQQIYRSISQISFSDPSVEKLYKDLKSLSLKNKNIMEKKIFFNQLISLKNIHYSYPNTTRNILKNINLSIPNKSIIGLVGATGSGKTTIVDIILGLLDPQKGTLEVDGTVITNNNLKAWQKLIGYVPQHIYLADDTISANIAFGVEPKKIDKAAVEKASKIANVHEFVVNEMPEKYQTKIGERGVRLSGGQRQRIGIARALYHNPQLLIFDEATSALDENTEMKVMEAINNLSKNITIILIAHRLNTLKKCDIIYNLENGQITKQGTFNQIII